MWAAFGNHQPQASIVVRPPRNVKPRKTSQGPESQQSQRGCRSSTWDNLQQCLEMLVQGYYSSEEQVTIPGLSSRHPVPSMHCQDLLAIWQVSGATVFAMNKGNDHHAHTAEQTREVELEASVVTLKHAAHADDAGLINPLLKKAQQHLLPEKVINFRCAEQVSWRYRTTESFCCHLQSSSLLYGDISDHG